MKIYTIHDAKAEFHFQPFYARTNADAMRTFTQTVNDNNPQNLIAQSPSDFTLFYIGEFDEQSGVISPAERHSLANGKDVQVQIQQ